MKLHRRPGRFLATALLLGSVVAPAGAATAAGSGAGGTTFTTYPGPGDLGVAAGEPSIGYNARTGATLFQAEKQTLRVIFSGRGPATKAAWKDVTFPLTGAASLDPILFTERETGRTIVSQLLPPCSLSAVTTDDGASWTPAQGCSTPGGADHQTIGGGPTQLPAAVDGKVFYYCSQSVVAATCGSSVDGGLSYGPAVPIYPLDAAPAPGPMGCAGLHGHVKVAPDGTTYVPNFGCGNNDPTTTRQSVVVSEDSGLTWAVRQIPDATPNAARSDPSVGIDAAGKAYVAYEDKAGHLKVATTPDRGTSWTRSLDLGASKGVEYAVFPAVTAGSAGRAAIAWLGATKATGLPNTYENKLYDGVWHLYVAITDNGGATWTKTEVNPSDPVQRGCIYWGNGDCPSEARNLLDFMDITYDRDGRVLVGFADGCTGDCVTDDGPSRSARATIARLTCGRGVLAAGDAAIAADCAAPAVARTGRATSAPPRGGPPLPATGLAALPAVLAVVLLSAAALLRRRPHRR